MYCLEPVFISAIKLQFNLLPVAVKFRPGLLECLFLQLLLAALVFLALPGKAYISNWNALVFSFSIPIASILAVKFFVPLYRSLNSISAYNYLEIRFGQWARIYASICYMLTQLMRTGAILLLLALPLNLLFGWNIKTIIIVTGIAVTVYSMLGGIQAVIWTDAIQAIILIVGAIVLCGNFNIFDARRTCANI